MFNNTVKTIILLPLETPTTTPRKASLDKSVLGPRSVYNYTRLRIFRLLNGATNNEARRRTLRLSVGS